MKQLKAIEKNDQRVLTSAQLADAYGTDARTISKNFTRNKIRYTEGKHYFVLAGEELKTFKTNHQIDDQLKHSPSLYLWTAKGALFHAKSLGTDEAWTAYETLVDDYFNKVKQIQRSQMPTQIPSTIEDILELAVVNMKDLRKEIQEAREENKQLRLIVDNEIVLTTHQKAEIQQAVDRRQGELNREGYNSAHFQGIYKTLKNHFDVPGYADIKRVDFDKALKIIAGWYPKKNDQVGGA